MQAERSNTKKGWIVALLVHLLLLLTFLLIKIELRPFLLDFTEITFAPAAPVSGDGESTPQDAKGRPLIELPRRPMVAETSPLLKLPDRQRPPIEAVPERAMPDLASERAVVTKPRVDLTTPGAGVKSRPTMEALPIDDQLLTGERPDLLGQRVAGEDMFSINWNDGVVRLKMSGELPKFPSGVKQSASVSILFVIAPDGKVISTTPQTKGRPEFEQVSIAALRNWNFNPLDSTLPQVNQSGVITFQFRLK